MASLLNMSCSRLLNVSPYDAEIEYLESTGNCFIPTDYVPTGSDVHLQTQILYNGYTDYSLWVSWFATYVDEQTNTYRIIRNAAQNNEVIMYNGVRAGGSNARITVSIGTIYTIDFNRNVATINGTPRSLNYTGTIENTDTMKVFSPKFKGRFYYFRIYKADVLQLDLIPVRVGTTGYLYDKVSKQLFGNAGTGAFILGPDKTN